MRTVVARMGAVWAAVGSLVLVAGTFLPWLRSGAVLRDSYESVGALRTLLSGTPALLVNAWLLVIPLCLLCVALYAVRLRRVSAGIGVLVSLVVGTVATVVAVQGNNPAALVGAVVTGPAVTVVGATVALLGAIAILASPSGGHTATRGHS
jgi:hypothetical protein